MAHSVPIVLGRVPPSLNAQVARLVAERGEDTALTLLERDEATEQTTGAFFTEAGRYASALRDAGIGQGDLVVLVLPHGWPLLHLFWGAILLGATPSIFPFLSDKLDPARYFDSVGRMTTQAAARCVVTDEAMAPALAPHLPTGSTQLLTAERFQAAQHAPLPATAAQPRPDETALLQHSSGSTGLQKGVMLSHRALMNQIASYSHAIALDRRDVVVSWLPLYHDMGLIAGFILPLMQGIPLVLMSPFQWVRDPKRLLYAITRYGGTLCWLPNFAYNFMARQIREQDLEGVDLRSLRAVINCSEPVFAESHALFYERFAPYGLRENTLATCYAMAENTFAVTQSAVGQPLAVSTVDRQILAEAGRAEPVTDAARATTLVSCGRPIPACEVKVVNAAGATLEERHVGEIAVRSSFMLSGYYRRPDLSTAALVNGWYLTGDMGYVSNDELYITGRKKDLIIVGGKNVYPQDLEHLVNEVSGVHAGRTVAFGVPNAQLATEDVAIIAEVDTDDADRRAMIERTIRTTVAQNSEVTARYVYLAPRGWLVKTSSGKVARTANRTKYLNEVLKRNQT